jgi:predicted dehydrogenase/threonine dehydrogenase-like Zn-dependent dehydrogenase
MAVSKDVREFSVGDFVACGGGSANHAEIVFVPCNLCVKISPSADLQQASYNTLGAITLQGIRQADLRIGETCAVIGLGVIGQLTCILLRAAGIRTIGIDTNASLVELAKKHCADLACSRNDPAIEKRISEFTSHMGADAVVIAASSESLDPVNFAGAISRKKGTIVVVGGVPTGFDREPNYYNKELSLKMSCSYGPGRYDREYEEKGRDYPYAYVRWTEKRNMQAFQELIASRKIDLKYLTTHTFDINDAPAAYSMVLKRKEPFLGVLIKYSDARKPTATRIQVNPPRTAKSPISLGFVGAGSYAQGLLLPNLPKTPDIIRKGIITKTPTGSRSVAERFGFEFCTSNEDEIVANREINTVFIATRHDTHARYVMQALKAGKNTFVEKPLCLTTEELAEIESVLGSAGKKAKLGVLMVGYNRRFSPLTREIKRFLKAEPMSMIYRVNAGPMEPDSWAQDVEVGGGRILGEVCHFIDCLTFLCESLPTSVHARAMDQAGHEKDTLQISISYQNGSIASIQYFANGSRLVHKEYLEVYQNGITAMNDDFRRISVVGQKPLKRLKLKAQDKGQRAEIQAFLEAARHSDQSVMPIDQILSTSRVLFAILESLRSGNAVDV